MKSLLIVSISFSIICNNSQTNQKMCDSMKTDDSFTGVQAFHRFLKMPKIQTKYLMVSNGKEWIFSVKRNLNRKYNITSEEKSLEEIDGNIINRFGALYKYQRWPSSSTSGGV